MRKVGNNGLLCCKISRFFSVVLQICNFISTSFDVIVYNERSTMLIYNCFFYFHLVFVIRKKMVEHGNKERDALSTKCRFRNFFSSER